jgi:hypothetical protein
MVAGIMAIVAQADRKMIRRERQSTKAASADTRMVISVGHERHAVELSFGFCGSQAKAILAPPAD